MHMRDRDGALHRSFPDGARERKCIRQSSLLHFAWAVHALRGSFGCAAAGVADPDNRTIARPLAPASACWFMAEARGLVHAATLSRTGSAAPHDTTGFAHLLKLVP